MADDLTTSSSTTDVVFAGPMGTGTVSIIDKKTGRLRRRFSQRTAKIEFEVTKSNGGAGTIKPSKSEMTE